MEPLLNVKVFPGEILLSLENYLQNLGATSKYQHDLTRVMKDYNDPDGKEFVENLPFLIGYYEFPLVLHILSIQGGHIIHRIHPRRN